VLGQEEVCVLIYIRCFGAESFESLQMIHRIGSAESLFKRVIK
jgi:hypothetical protein